MPNREAVFLRIYAACGDRSSWDRLEILSLAWLAVASNARTEALIAPGGFQEERARQVGQLRQMADLIEHDAPNLEMERQFLEDDTGGLARYLQKALHQDWPIDGAEGNRHPSTEEENRHATILFRDLQAAIEQRTADIAERHRAFQRAYRGHAKAFVDAFTDIATYEGQTRWVERMQLYLDHAP